jgi:lauroyl/myristoyl acyltransferase
MQFLEFFAMAIYTSAGLVILAASCIFVMTPVCEIFLRKKYNIETESNIHVLLQQAFEEAEESNKQVNVIIELKEVDLEEAAD